MLNVAARLKAIEEKQKNAEGVFILFFNSDGTATVTIKGKEQTFPNEEEARKAINNACKDATVIIWDLELQEG